MCQQGLGKSNSAGPLMKFLMLRVKHPLKFSNLILLKSLKPKCWKVRVLGSCKDRFAADSSTLSAERVCCQANDSLALFSLASFTSSFTQSALPWARRRNKTKTEEPGDETLCKCSPLWPVSSPALYLSQQRIASAPGPEFTLNTNSLLSTFEGKEEWVSTKTLVMKRTQTSRFFLTFFFWLFSKV